MRILDTYALPHVERTGFDSDLSEEERAISDTVHRFARDVMRPLGIELDKMTSAEVIAPSSPLWGIYPAYAELGIDAQAIAEMAPAAAARIEALICEELGWGDAGLCLSVGVAGFPLRLAQAAGNQELIDLCQDRIGCWPVTQPDTGSDMIDAYGAERHPGTDALRGNVVAKFVGDEIVINGQTSAWVSNGTIAQVAVLCCPADYGDGILGRDGNQHRAVIIVPLDGREVSRGKPLVKIGQQALPQGQIFFDNLRVPRPWGLCQEAAGTPGFFSVLSEAGVFMSQCFTGLARAAFEHALRYAHERKQGGAVLARHQLVRYRLGEMYKKIEACRAMTRRAGHYLRTAPAPNATVSSASKAFVTQMAFEVASDALQLLGGNGLTKEYPTEKLLRDARAALIEDGENYFLTLRLGSTVCDLYEAGWARD